MFQRWIVGLLIASSALRSDPAKADDWSRESQVTTGEGRNAETVSVATRAIFTGRKITVAQQVSRNCLQKVHAETAQATIPIGNLQYHTVYQSTTEE